MSVCAVDIAQDFGDLLDGLVREDSDVASDGLGLDVPSFEDVLDAPDWLIQLVGDLPNG
jgi:hypothetical protein